MWIAVLMMVQIAPVAAADSRPNVVLIMTDDQGWGDLHCHGNDKINTPVLDALAERSVQFDRFFVSPVCAPTRSSLLSGRYDVRTGVSGVTGRREVMRASEVTVAEILKAAGYSTGCFGKWHNGEQYPNHPTGQGFDEFFGFCGGHWNNYFATPLEHRGQQVATSGYITDEITAAAVQFISTRNDGPFFCYVPYNAPHTPWQVPDKWFARYEGAELDTATRCAYAMVENIDHNIGRILKSLDDRNLTQNTIVIFLTDNGPNGKRYNGDMRGAKGSVHEGGMRVPLFISWPGSLTPRRVSNSAAHIDLLPTIAELCDVPVQNTKPLDGRSLVPLFDGEDSVEWPDRMLFTYRRTGTGQIRGSVRTQRFRFVRETRDQLYDMVADPSETTDMAQKRPEQFAALQTALNEFVAEIEPGIQKPVPVPVGYLQAPSVELPAVEASLAGNARFLNGQGWAHDWITGLATADDLVSWEVDVDTGGPFDVDLVYACPESSRGTTVSLTSVDTGTPDSATTATITNAFDSPITGRPERTTPKGERKTRTFATMSLGTICLPAGPNVLQLRITSPSSSSPVDVDAIRLHRR